MEKQPFFILKVPLAIILFISKNKVTNTSIIRKKLDITYGTSVKLVSLFESNGWVEKVKIGRENHIKLTKNGEELAKLLSKLIWDLKQ